MQLRLAVTIGLFALCPLQAEASSYTFSGVLSTGEAVTGSFSYDPIGVFVRDADEFGTDFTVPSLTYSLDLGTEILTNLGPWIRLYEPSPDLIGFEIFDHAADYGLVFFFNRTAIPTTTELPDVLDPAGFVSGSFGGTSLTGSQPVIEHRFHGTISEFNAVPEPSIALLLLAAYAFYRLCSGQRNHSTTSERISPANAGA